MTKHLRERRKASKEVAARQAEQRDLKAALERIEELEAHTQAIRRLQGSTKRIAIKPRQGSNTSEAVAIAVASDWHIGQEVTAVQTNCLNEYNVHVAKVRAKTFFERVVRLTNKERQDVTIDELVLVLGGDFIEGALHLDTIMGSDLSGPMSQVILAQQLISGGLDYLKAYGSFKKITVVCCDGNHGRVTAKMHHHSRIGNALEYYLYYNLAQQHPDLQWVIEESLLTYLPVYDRTIRIMHGDRISFGGVNGFYTYLHRRIYEWDTSVRADYTILCHLHTYTPGRRYLVNGSLVGYNAFAISLGARYEPPTQSFMLFDKKRGPTVHMPILV